jgi:YgiT-type zinc finger domain-containing protein
MMTCVICGHGETGPGSVTVTLHREDATIIFKSVPAEVWENCSEC